jgi:serine beta-lactamase-like protein LACTB, mitochondrial
MTRVRAEGALAVVLAAAILIAGGAAIYFVFTMSVHTDPAAVPSTVAAAPAERYSAAVEEARRLARSLVVDENLPGVSVAVAHDGRIVWAEGFGWADVERRVPATPRTRFRIGAVSKPLTAAAAGLLHDRGRLDLDAPVQQYVPAFPPKEWPVSTRQLMGDVAGVHHGGGEYEGLPNRHCTGLDEALQIFGGDPLRFRPGTRYRYSVYGWVLVSAVVEAAAAEPFPRFMTREVFEPLGMDRTVLDEIGGVPDRAAFYYPRMATRTDLGLEDASPADYSCWAGAGAFLSTPSDLVRFGSAMLKPGLLKAETLALFQTPLRLESGASTGYALGWKVESVQLAGAPARLLSHRGSPIGGSASLMMFPDLGLAIAALTNVSHAKGVAPFSLKVAEAFAKPASERVQ